MLHEQPVTLRAQDALLAGILHAPEGPGRLQGLGIVMVPGGFTRRVGLHRLYILAARAFSGQGARVLRFDLPGIGESGGEVRWATPARLPSLKACYVEEVRAALDHLEGTASLDSLVVLGHCTGARSAAACASEDPRVRGVVAWGMSLGTDEVPEVDPWARDALRRLIERRTPVFCAYGTRDPAWPGFQQFVAGLAPAEQDAVNARWAVRTIPSANHDFTSVAWSRALIDASGEWMGGFGKPR